MALTSAEMGEELSSSLQVITDYFLAWQLQAAEYQRLSSRTVSLVSPSTQPIQYQFQTSPADTLSFTLRATRGDGDCFFHAVNQPGFTREALVRKLLECSGNEEVRRVFAHEIRQFLYLGHTGRHPDRQEDAACRVLLTRGIQPLVVTFLAAEEPLRRQVDVARTRLGEESTRGKMPEELLGLLEAHHADLVPAFRQAHSAVLEADEAIYRYCCQESVFREYVERYLRDARGYIPFSRELGRELPITTIDVINRLFGLKIQVYLLRGREGRQLQLANQPQTGASTSTPGVGGRDSSVRLARDAATVTGVAAAAEVGVARAATREVISIFHNGINHFSGLNVFMPPRLREAEERAGAREDRDSLPPLLMAAASASTVDRQSWGDGGGAASGASSSASAGTAGGADASAAASRLETTRAASPRTPVAHFLESGEAFARRLQAEDYVDRQAYAGSFSGAAVFRGYASAVGAHVDEAVDRQLCGGDGAVGDASSASPGAGRTATGASVSVAREDRDSLPPFPTVATQATPLPDIPYDRGSLDEIIEELPIDADIKAKISTHLTSIGKQVSDIRRYQSKRQPEHFYLAMRTAALEIRNIADALYELTKRYHAIFPNTLKQLILKWISPLEAELEKRLEMSASDRDELQLKTKHLYAEQSFISREPSLQQALMQHLRRLKQLFEEPTRPTPRCYISYAWPSEEKKEQEYWVQPFLYVLYEHLTETGIRVIMDIRDNKPGESIYQFMRHYQDGNYIILVGTESLLQKHYSIIPHAVQTELSIITRRSERDQKQFGQSRVYPMLISGTINTCYPERYQLYSTVRDAREQGYLGTLKTLTDWVYERRLGSVKEQHADLWYTFNENCRGLPRDLLTVEREIALGYHRQRLEFLRQDIQYQGVQAQEKTEHSAAVQVEMIGTLMKSQGTSPQTLYDASGEQFQRPDINPDFVQRQQLWDKMTQHFDKQDSQILTLTAHGLGGMGKTELAKYYYLHPPKPYSFRIWFRAESKDLLYQQYVKLGENNGMRFLEKMPVEQKALLVKERWLERQKDCLLVYDDVPNANEVEGLLPKQGKHHILMTSRNAVDWSVHQKLDVDVMEENEAIALIVKITGSHENKEKVQQLVRTLGYFPLALAQAGAYIDVKEVTIEEYLKRYQQHQVKWLSDKTSRSPKHETVWVTFDMNFKALETNCPAALMTLKYVSWLSHAAIPEVLLHSMLTDSTEHHDLLWDDIKEQLKRYSLMRVDRERHQLSIHPLLQDILRSQINEQLHSEQVLEEYLQPLSKALCVLYADQKTELSAYGLTNQSVSHFLRLQEHLQAQEKLSQASKRTNMIIRGSLLDLLGDAFEASGDFTQQVKFLHEALGLKKELYGVENIEYLKTLNALAEAQNYLGKWVEQICSLEEAIGIYKRCKSFAGRDKLYSKSLKQLITAYELLDDRDKVFSALVNASGEINVSQLVIAVLEKSPATPEQTIQIFPVLLSEAIKDEGYSLILMSTLPRSISESNGILAELKIDEVYVIIIEDGQKQLWYLQNDCLPEQLKSKDGQSGSLNALLAKFNESVESLSKEDLKSIKFITGHFQQKRIEAIQALGALKLTAEQITQVFPVLLEAASEGYGYYAMKVAFEALRSLELSVEQKTQVLPIVVMKMNSLKGHELHYEAALRILSAFSLYLTTEQKIQVLPSILMASRDAHSTLSEAAHMALVALDYTAEQKAQIFPELLATTRSSDNNARLHAIEALMSLSLTDEHKTQLFPVLLAATKDEDVDVSRTSFRALLDFNLTVEQAVQAFPVLLAGAKDEDKYTKHSAFRTLKRLKLTDEQITQVFPVLLTTLINEGKGKVKYKYITYASESSRDVALGVLMELRLTTEQKIQVFPAVLAATKDEWVKKAAFKVLRALGLTIEQKTQVFCSLLAMARNEDVNVKRVAFQALGALSLTTEQKTQTFPMLLTGTKDENRDVRYAAIQSLETLDLPAEQKIQVFPAMLAVTKSKDQWITGAALQILRALSLTIEQKTQIFPMLLTGTKDENRDVRYAAIQSLETLDLTAEQTTQIFPALLAATKDENWEIKKAVFEDLRVLKLTAEQTAQVFPVLLTTIRSKNVEWKEDSRHAALRNLWNLEDLTIEQIAQFFPALLPELPTLLTTIRNNDVAWKEDSRHVALQALGNLDLTTEQKKQVFPILLTAINDKDYRVRLSAFQVLGTLDCTSEQKNQLFHALLVLIRGQDSYTGKSQQDSYKGQRKEEARQVLWALDLTTEQTTQMFHVLLTATKDEDWVTRMHTFKTLRALNLTAEQTAQVFPVLLEAIKDKYRAIWMEAISTLGALALTEEQKIEIFPVILALNSEDGDVVCKALGVLELNASQRAQIFLAMLEKIKSGNNDVKRASIKALGALTLSLEQKAEIFPALLVVIKDNIDNGIGNSFIEGLIGNSVSKVLASLEWTMEQQTQIFLMVLVAAKHKDNNIKKAAFEFLSDFDWNPEQTAQFFPILLEAATIKNELRYTAFDALRSLNLTVEQTTQVFPILLEVTKSEPNNAALKTLVSLNLTVAQTAQVFSMLDEDDWNLALSTLELTTEQTAHVFSVLLTRIKYARGYYDHTAIKTLRYLRLTAEQTAQIFLVLLNEFKDGKEYDTEEVIKVFRDLNLTAEQAEKLLPKLLAASRSFSTEAGYTLIMASAKEILGILYARLGNDVKSLELLKESLKIKKRYYGVRHSEYALTLSLLAKYYLDIGNVKEALPYFEKALPVFKKEYDKKCKIYKCCLEQYHQAQERLSRTSSSGGAQSPRSPVAAEADAAADVVREGVVPPDAPVADALPQPPGAVAGGDVAMLPAAVDEDRVREARDAGKEARNRGGILGRHPRPHVHGGADNPPQTNDLGSDSEFTEGGSRRKKQKTEKG